MSDPLIDSLRYRPVATTAAQMREAADRIERLERELAAWLQVWDNVHLDVPELGTSNKPLAVAATYELIKRERDAAIAEAEALRHDMERQANTLAELATENEALRKTLAMLYDKWEDGNDCYQDVETETGFLGHAFKLSLAEEDQVIALIGKDAAIAKEKP